MSTEDPAPTEREIMEATFDALTEHGYGDLTIQSIADQFEKSKSLLYYHYDGKEELLADFLEYTLEEFVEQTLVDDAPPVEQLASLIDLLFPETIDDDHFRVQIALLELRAQAPHTEQYRERFTAIDRTLAERVESILERGMAEGTIRDVDPALEAELFVSMVVGIQSRRLTTDEFRIERSRAAVREHVRRRLLAPGAENGALG